MQKKGFTLIELLAVIVILAIIALVAVPIILNVIDTVRKGAKESSTLSYIDAVEKQVMMSQVDSTATKISSGTYDVNGLTLLGVKVKGEKPNDDSVLTINTKGHVTEAWITYEASDYKIYYDGKEAVADTSDYKDSKGGTHNTIAIPGIISSSAISTCPGCKYIYTTDTLTIGTSTIPSTAESDYTLVSNNYSVFLGLIANSSTGIIEREFVCSTETGTPFCLEGKDTSKWSNEANIGIMNTIFPGCGVSDSNWYGMCTTTTLQVSADGPGWISMHTITSPSIECTAEADGKAWCRSL